MNWDDIGASCDRVAAAYETRFVDELADKPRDRAWLSEFAAASDGWVLDVGCGPGHIGACVRGDGRRVIGVDVSHEMTIHAAGRLDGALVGDLRCLPVASGSFAGVLAFYSLIHVPRQDLRAALAELGRVVHDGGVVLVAVHEGEGMLTAEEFLGEDVPFVATLFGLDELVDAARSAGLGVVRAERRAPYPTESETCRVYLEAVG